MKVLISSRTNYNLEQMVFEGFKKNHISVELSLQPEISDFNKLKSLMYKFKTKINSDLLENQVIVDQNVKEYNLNLYDKIIKNDYDILFVLQGEFILPQFFQKIIKKKTVKNYIVVH